MITADTIHAFFLAASALLSIVNPVGSALIFAQVTSHRSPAERRFLSGRIAIYAAAVMIGALWIGAPLLAFFGVSLAALRIAGGLVVAASAWTLLNVPDESEARRTSEEADLPHAADVAFYPLTLPFTTGPGTISVAIALSSNGLAEGAARVPFLVAMSLAALTVALLHRPRLFVRGQDRRPARPRRQPHRDAAFGLSPSVHRCRNRPERRRRLRAYAGFPMTPPDKRPPRILFVCLGNICRSPLAEAALRQAASASGLALDVDSAGTGPWHIGEPPDPRAQAVARRHGCDISRLRGRQVDADDFRRFDRIYALDPANLATLRRLAPPDAQAEVSLLLDVVPGRAGEGVHDPYYGPESGFEAAWRDVAQAAHVLVAQLKPPAKR